VLIHGFTDNDIHPPRFGSTQRTFGLYRGLARRHQVRVLCVVEYRNRAARSSRPDGVEIVRRRAWYTAAAWRLERLGLAPLWLATAGHARRAQALAATLAGEPDIRAFDFGLAAPGSLPGRSLRVYLSQNVEYDFYRATAPRVLARAWWAGRVKDYEGRAARGADVVVAVTEEDAARFTALHGVAPERLVVIPNGWDETALRAGAPAERAAARAALGLAPADYAALFVGSDFSHNREALRWCVERLMPEAASAGVRLIAAGAVARVLAGRREPWLIVRPDVPDLLPLLHAADAGLNPVAHGGGSNVKLPTYLGAGLAVVSTAFGLRGYAPLAPRVRIAEREGFAAALAARPRGWSVEGATTPADVAAYAWGALGERLGERLESARADLDARPRRTVA